VNWIDLCHGKVMEEDGLESSRNVIVKVDSVVKTARDPFAVDFSDGGDYYVEYETGAVVFAASQAGHTVTATYNYATGSGWYLAPSEGRLLFLKEAEINMSADVVISDTICYYIQVYVPGYGWYTVGDSFYKTAWQIVQECRGNHPVIPAFGGPIRGLQHDAIQLPFVYVADRELKASESVRLNARLKDDKAFLGEHASITFYCLSREE
jgi:hypothetical protein